MLAASLRESASAGDIACERKQTLASNDEHEHQVLSMAFFPRELILKQSTRLLPTSRTNLETLMLPAKSINLARGRCNLKFPGFLSGVFSVRLVFHVDSAKQHT